MRYILKKAAAFFLTLVIVAFLTFLAFQVIPGDPALSRLGTQATPERVEALRREMGLDRPLPVRFGSWAAAFLKGDMGTSYSYSMPVGQLIADKLPATLTLSVLAFVFILAVSIPLGLFTAKCGGAWDRVIGFLNQIVMSVPPFFAGILLTYVFGIVFRLFTPGGYVSFETDPKGFLSYMILPAVAVALPRAAMTVRLLRDSILKEAKKDYVRTAYSRGNDTWGVLLGHVLKNAMLPVITFLALALADIVAESIVIEQVFGIPGLGRLLITSISNRDYPVVQAIVVCIAAVVIFTNFAADVIYRLMDPRIGTMDAAENAMD